ncbi:MAG: hypothetical protein Tsb0010_06480 [Parvularculaceae bacterium]
MLAILAAAMPASSPFSKPRLAYYWRMFLAWWEGEEFDAAAERARMEAELEALREAAGAEEAEEGPVSVAFGHDETYRAKEQEMGDRLRVAEMIWGPGYIHPGAEETHLEYAKAMRMSGEKSMAVVGLGLGGPAREMSRDTGVWVTGYAWPKTVADAAREQCKTAGMAKKVEVVDFDPDNDELPKGKYAGLICLAELGFVQKKAALIKQMFESLKKGGAFLVTDYVVEEGAKVAGFDPSWGTPNFWTEEKYKTVIQKCGFDFRVGEDLTKDHLALIVEAWKDWKRIVEGIKSANLDDETKARMLKILVAEANLWADRQEALRSGALRYFRFFGMK